VASPGQFLPDPVGAALEGTDDSTDGLVVGVLDPPNGSGALVELSQGVGQQGQGVPAGGVLDHPSGEARSELESRSPPGCLDHLGESRPAERFHDERVVDELGQPRALR
jgi:hypothetical protein